MTKEERVTKLKAYITCLKCRIRGYSCDDNCPTQYEAGNMGEIIENLKEISKILEQEPTTKNGISNKSIIYKVKESKEIQEDLDKLSKLNKSTVKNDLGVEECVNKAEFVKKLENETIGLQSWQKALVYQIMDDCHSVTSQEPKTGHWIIYNYPGHECVYCSSCKEEYYEDDLYMGGSDFPNYCPNCGAKMVEIQKSEDTE